MAQVKFSFLVFLVFFCEARSIKFNFSAELLTPGHECVRECKEGDLPKFCYYRFNLELYVTQSGACDLCKLDNMFHSTCQCIEADGYERSLLSVNRMFPGPSVQVCAGDRIIVDITNDIDGFETSFHWHGLLQQNTQYFDGVPMVTQCPIATGQTFRYQMIANEGTYFYHTHSGLQKFNGLQGSVISRQPRTLDPNSHLFDYDLPEHIVFVNDWMHVLVEEKFPGLRTRDQGQDPKTLLINGKGRWTNPDFGNTTSSSLAEFNVTKGFRYRLRMINGMSSSCGLGMRIIGHNVTIIATDGENVTPKTVDVLYSSAGERYDFVVNANQAPQKYWIQFWATGVCQNDAIQQLAILNYEGAKGFKTANPPTYQQAQNITGVSFNGAISRCNNGSSTEVCPSALVNPKPVDDKLLLKEEPDVKLYINFTFTQFTPEELFKPKTYRRYALLGTAYAQAQINGYSYKMPSSPLLSQYHDVKKMICTEDKRPTDCQGNCSCTHIIKVPLNAVVEMVLVDAVDFDDVHAFHLHGHTFKVLGMGTPGDLNITSANTNNIKQLDAQGKLRRNLKNPPNKDTITVPNHGYAIIRFRANNPGFWLMHCHFDVHMVAGMAVVIQVGELEDIPPVPDKFPKCRSYIPDIEPALLEYTPIESA